MTQPNSQLASPLGSPLANIRILDLSRLIPGPFATLALSDLGASVDKVEDLHAGDYLRALEPQKGGHSVAFSALNRGKRSLAIDLKAPAGRDALFDLIGHYDVVLEQFRPGVMDRLGLGHDKLRARYGELIICALTGYGQTGPLRLRAGHDLNYLARAGLLGFQGPMGEPPAVPAFQLADVSGGLWCALGIVAALRSRDAGEGGTVLDIAMADSVAGFATTSLAGALAGHQQPRGGEGLTGGIAPYRAYLSSDGVPVALAALEPKFWSAFCGGVGLEIDLVALLPGPHQPDWIARLEQVFLQRDAESWRKFADAHDCCLEVALEPQDLTADAQLTARGVFLEIPTGAETTTGYRTPLTPRDHVAGPVPAQGQHSIAILREGGLSQDRIDALIEAGVVRAAPP